MKILAIETSCDETALALVETTISNESITAHTIKSALFSQIDIHKEFGGVFPAVAKREHAKWLPVLMKEVLEDTCHPAPVAGSSDTNTETPKQAHPIEGLQSFGLVQGDTLLEIEQLLSREIGLFEDFQKIIPTLTKPDIDMIAVTEGPGLEPALWVGISFARALSLYWNIPLIGVNHMKGHVFSVLLNKQEIHFPALALLISGGHTELVHMNSIHEFKIIGQTKDDAVGESYDKVARMLGFEYPGGPKIAELAQHARDTGIKSGDIVLPRPMIHSHDCDFSFSGLKTAVLYKIKELGELDQNLKLNIAHEFEEAVVDVLIKKLHRAIESSNPFYKTLIVSGGVIANTYIRSRLTEFTQSHSIEILLPTHTDSTDNAQMIAVAGAIKSLNIKPSINPEVQAFGSATY